MNVQIRNVGVGMHTFKHAQLPAGDGKSLHERVIELFQVIRAKR